MTRQTTVLRLLLVLLLVGLTAALALVYVVTLDAAASYPQLAHLRLPFCAAVLVGLVPVAAGVKVVFDVVGLVDRGEAFSTSAVRLLRRLEVLIGVTAAYLFLGVIGTTAALEHVDLATPGVPLAGLAAEVATLFLLALAALLRRLFAAALVLRQDDELTV